MATNLGPQSVRASYGKLVQVDGNALYDGTGSIIPSLDITASYALNATDGASVTISSTPPSNPNDGDLWYYDGDGQTYVYLANSSAWVTTNNGFFPFATSASYARTASYVEGGTFESASYANFADLAATASYFSGSISTAESASYSTTASYIEGGVSNTADTFLSTQPIYQIVTLTQAEYDDLGSVDANTLYITS